MWKATLFLAFVLASCTPKPPRPVAQDPAQVRELEQCDYLYSACLGQSGAADAGGSQLTPIDTTRGRPVDCNKRLKTCYERVKK